MLDLVLAIVHHLLVFTLFGLLFAEFFVLRPGVSTATLARIARLDLWYGIFAALIVLVGVGRATLAAKGWFYYAHNAFFWAKLASFAAIGALSVPPTLSFIRWRRSAAVPDEAAIRGVRRYLHAELALFILVLGFAAAMARGYGEFS